MKDRRRNKKSIALFHLLFVFALLLGSCLPGIFACAAARAKQVAPDAVPLRGVVEGFYGTPWTQQERLDMLSFCGRVGFNAYIYAPKDDAYHRSQWRLPYPPQKLTELAALVKAAKAERVRFIFAVSPGMDLFYRGHAGAEDQAAMLAKCETLYGVGVRDFAIFFDDIEQKDGPGQAAFLNAVSARLRARHHDIGAILTVPTEYFRADMVDAAGGVKPYTASFSKLLSPDILVLYTGEGVVKGNLTAEEYQAAEGIYSRPLGIWWNYPVTDYKETNLALGPVENLPLKGVPAVFFNPMRHEQMSRISLATAASLANHPSHYEPQTAWQEAVERQYGSLAPAMMTVAEHAQHLETSWADIGRSDAPALRQEMDALWQSYPRGVLLRLRVQRLDDRLAQIEMATEKLLLELPGTQLAECRPQLLQLQRIVRADRLGITLLAARRNGKMTAAQQTSFLAARQAVIAHDGEARISEKTARAFLDELTDHLNLVNETVGN